jgi:Cyclic nucleotide-binding domain/Ion transport protein
MRLEPVVRYRVWEVLITASILFLAIEAPLRLVLNYELSQIGYWLSTLVLCCDVFVQASPPVRRFKARFKQGAAQRGAKDVPISFPWLVVDVIAAIPFRFLPGGALLEPLRMVKLARIVQLLQRWRRHAVQNGTALLLASFAFWLLLIAHWLACGWLALGGIGPAGDDFTRYLHSLYWCITTLATVGYGDIVPKTNAQIGYAMVVILLGVGVYGYVIGNVANLLANLDMAKRHHMENMERLVAFLRHRNIPIDLQRRLRDYYAYLWENRMGYDEASVMEDLPQGLRTEVALCLRRDFIERTPLFKNASHELVREIALQLRPAVFTPGEYIFRAGQHGRHMYFIGRGTVEIIVGDGKTVLTTLKDGDFFGELALLFSQRRTASVRAVDYCDLYSLDKETFEHAISRYPDFAAHIKDEAERRNPQ